MSKQIRSPFIKAADYPKPIIAAMTAVMPFPKTYRQSKETFVRAFCASVCLNLSEKHRLLTELPRMAQFQLEMLSGEWREEEEKFNVLLSNKWGDGVVLVARSWLSNSLLATHLGARWNPRMEASAMRDFVLSYYARKGRRTLLKAALAKKQSSLAEHVFGRALASSNGCSPGETDGAFRI